MQTHLSTVDTTAKDDGRHGSSAGLNSLTTDSQQVLGLLLLLGDQAVMGLHDLVVPAYEYISAIF